MRRITVEVNNTDLDELVESGEIKFSLKDKKTLVLRYFDTYDE